MRDYSFLKVLLSTRTHLNRTPKWIHLTPMKASCETTSFHHRSLTIITREGTQVFRRMVKRMRNFTRILNTLWTLLDIVMFQQMWTITQTSIAPARISATRNSHYHKILRLMAVVDKTLTRMCNSIGLLEDCKEHLLIQSHKIVLWAQWKPCLLKMNSWIPFKSIIIQIQTKLKLTRMEPTSKCLAEHKNHLLLSPLTFRCLLHNWVPKILKIKFTGPVLWLVVISCKGLWQMIENLELEKKTSLKICHHIQQSSKVLAQLTTLQKNLLETPNNNSNSAYKVWELTTGKRFLTVSI